MTIREMIEVLQHYENGGEVEGANHVQSVDGTLWYKVTNNNFDFSMNDYRIKEKPEFTYPMWFKCLESDYTVEFNALNKGKVVKSSKHAPYDVGFTSTVWVSHTRVDTWKQVEEPKTKVVYEIMFKHISGSWHVRDKLLTETELLDCKDDELFTQYQKTGRQWEVPND